MDDVTVKDIGSTYEKAVEGFGSSIKVYGTIAAVILTSNRAGISNLLDKLMSSFIWMRLVNGPRLVYPSMLWKYLTFKKAELFGIKNPFEKIGEECNLPAHLEESKTKCNFLGNYGDDMVFLGCCILIAILTYWIKRMVLLAIMPSHRSTARIVPTRSSLKRTNEKRLDKQTKGRRTPIFARIISLVDSSIGRDFTLNEFHAGTMEFMTYATIHFCHIKLNKWSLIGTGFAITFVTYFTILNFVEYKFVMHHRHAVKVQKSNRSSQSFMKIVENSPPTAWNMVGYAHQGTAVPRRPVYLFMVSFEQLLTLLKSSLLYITINFGYLQVLVACFLQVKFTVLVIDSRNKLSSFENFSAIVTVSLELLFCVLKIFSVFITNKFMLEEVIGLAIAVALGGLVLLNLVFITWEVLVTLVINPISRCKLSQSKPVQKEFKDAKQIFDPKSDKSTKLSFAQTLGRQRIFKKSSKQMSPSLKGTKNQDLREEEQQKKPHQNFTTQMMIRRTLRVLVSTPQTSLHRIRQGSKALEDELKDSSPNTSRSEKQSCGSPAGIIKYSGFSPSRKVSKKILSSREKVASKHSTDSPTTRCSDATYKLEKLDSNIEHIRHDDSKIDRADSNWLLRRVPELDQKKVHRLMHACSSINHNKQSEKKTERQDSGKEQSRSRFVIDTPISSKRHLMLNEANDNL